MSSSASSSAAATSSSSSPSSRNISSSSSATGWTHQTEERAAQNMSRNRDMLECQAQLRHWKKRWNSTKQQFKQASMVASLRADPQRWSSLPKRAKWDKTNVLTVFQHHKEEQEGDGLSSSLPAQLQENKFATAAPAAIVNDKDVFLARISTRHCQEYYSDFSCLVGHERLPLAVPQNLRDDPDVIRRLLELYADYFSCQVKLQKDEADWIVPGDTVWNDPQLFEIFVSHVEVDILWPYLKILADMPVDLRNALTHMEDGLRKVVARFAWSIRNDPDVVFQVLMASHHKDSDSYEAGLKLLLDACRLATPPQGKEQNHHHQQQQQPSSVKATEAADTTTTTAASSPPLLKNNKSFALRLISAQDLPDLPESTLKWFSKRLRDDDQVVLAMVRRQGMTLRYASFRLRRNRKVILAAFEQDPRSLIWAIGNSSGRRALERQRDCMLLFFEKLQLSEKELERSKLKLGATPEELSMLSQHSSACRRAWKRLPTNFQNDPDIARAALLTGCVARSDLPKSIEYSREFWYRTIQTFPHAFDAMPVQWKVNVEFLRALPSYPETHIWFRVWNCPELINDREVWRKLTDPFAWYYAFRHYDVPPAILHDKELMVLACSIRGDVYPYLENPLNEDCDILDAALTSSPDLLDEIPDHLQLRYPHLVAKAIRQWGKDEDVWDLFDGVCEDLWSNPLVARAWAARGGDYLHEEFDDDMENDKELFLLIAQHNPHDFWCASERLCNDKEYMMQVVGKNPLLLREASRSLLNNFDVALVAFGGGDDDADDGSVAALRSRDLPGSFDINDREDFEFITGFAAKVRERLATHEIFVTVVMCGMSAAKNAAKAECTVTDNHFRTLDQGSETSMAYRVLLADFMGVPVGKELRRLRSASVNLAAWGY